MTESQRGRGFEKLISQYKSIEAEKENYDFSGELSGEALEFTKRYWVVMDKLEEMEIYPKDFLGRKSEGTDITTLKQETLELQLTEYNKIVDLLKQHPGYINPEQRSGYFSLIAAQGFQHMDTINLLTPNIVNEIQISHITPSNFKKPRKSAQALTRAIAEYCMKYGKEKKDVKVYDIEIEENYPLRVRFQDVESSGGRLTIDFQNGDGLSSYARGDGFGNFHSYKEFIGTNWLSSRLPNMWEHEIENKEAVALLQQDYHRLLQAVHDALGLQSKNNYRRRLI